MQGEWRTVAATSATDWGVDAVDAGTPGPTTEKDDVLYFSAGHVCQKRRQD